MTKLDVFLLFYFLINIFVAIIFPFILLEECDDKKYCLCVCFWYWLREKLKKKNAFGKILVIILCICIIPSLFMLICLDLIGCFLVLINFIWKLGDKKENK